jgi:serine/threonine protein kinase
VDAPAKVHPTDETLSSFGLGKLDDAAAESVSRHIERCPQCRKRVAEMPDDSFLGRFRSAGQGDKSLAVQSQLSEPQAVSATGTQVPPPPGTIPPALTGHATYEIKRELGRGGMGVVYLAHNKLMGRDEVLKVVGAHLLNRKGVLDRFLREVRSAAKLHHPNIVTAYSALPIGDSLALSMEYVEGDDLAQLVSAKGPLPVPQACNFVYQAALGLQHAHERGMVHRDIKPSNLMLARDGKKAVIKVLDFGLAKVTSEGLAERGLTHDGQMLGTPEYIAPEQIKNARLADIRADIYSLGCTLYYLLAGGTPFHGESLWDLYQAHFSMEAGPLNLVRPDVPVELAALVAKMMAKEPERRFQTPGEVAQALVPFFKAGTNPAVGHRIGNFRSQQAESPRPPAASASARQPTSPGASSAIPQQQALKPNPEGVAWERLIELGEPDQLTIAATASSGAKSRIVPEHLIGLARMKRPPSRWRLMSTAVLSLAVISLGVIIYIATDNGRIKIVVNGPRPVV